MKLFNTRNLSKIWRTAIISCGILALALVDSTTATNANHYDSSNKWTASVWKDGKPVLSVDFNPENNSLECTGSYYFSTSARSCNAYYPHGGWTHDVDTLYITFRFWVRQYPSAVFNVYHNQIDDEGEVNQSEVFLCQWTTWDDHTSLSVHTMDGYYEAFPEVLDFETGATPGALCGKR